MLACSVPVRVTKFSDVGRQTLSRAQLEAERRYCGNKTEQLQLTSEIQMSAREKLCTLLDLRTFGAKHLSQKQADDAMRLLEGAYVTCVPSMYVTFGLPRSERVSRRRK